MRLAFLADAGSNHTERWVRYFAENGNEVHLVSDRAYRSSGVENVELHILKPPGFRVKFVSTFAKDLSNIIKIRSLLKQIKPDVLHAHYVTSWGFLGAMSRFHPFVLTAWGSDVLVEPKQSKVSKWIAEYALKRADLVTCDAEHMREALMKMGLVPERIEIIHFGTDTERFNPRQRDTKLLEKLGAKDSPVIISARSLEPVYDIPSLIQAAPSVLKEFPRAKFIIAGIGSQEVELKALAGSLGIAQSLVFTGRLNQDELPHYLASATVYVSTSLSDAGLSGSTSEAMSSGVPVIITDFGDNRKWVEDGESGVIIPLKDPAALASKIVYLSQHEDIRRKYGQAGRKVIEERNSQKREMGKMADLYRGLAAKSGSLRKTRQ